MITVKNHKDIYQKAADKLGIDVEVVTNVGTFTWNDLNKRMSNLQNREIYVLGLGSFIVIKGYAERFISRIYGPKKPQVFVTPEQQLIHNLGIKEKLLPLIEEWNVIKSEREEFNKTKKVNGSTESDIQES